jgi:hypothetical protein
MALGAEAVDIGVLVGHQTLAMPVGCIVLGLAAAMASAQWPHASNLASLSGRRTRLMRA